jgi:multidrug transporter EmrE-like cation transporter
MMTLILAVFSVSLNAAAQIFLRKTMVGVGPLPGDRSDLIAYAFAVVLNPWFIAGMTCYAVSIGVWLIVLSKLEVSVAYPLLSIGYVITAVVGFFFLGENVTLLRVFGIALICGGLFFITRTA